MPDHEDIYINGFLFAADIDMGIPATREDPGENRALLAVYIEGDDGEWVELPSWSKKIEDAISSYLFDKEKYAMLYGKHELPESRGTKTGQLVAMHLEEEE